MISVGGKEPRATVSGPRDRGEGRLIKREYGLLISKEGTDCKVFCQGQILELHKTKFLRSEVLKTMFYGKFKESHSGEVQFTDSLDLCIALIYYLYTEQYLTEQSTWKGIISAQCPGVTISCCAENPLYHAKMFELGQRYDLSELKREAYEHFVRKAFDLNSASSLSQQDSTADSIIHEDDDSEQDTDSEPGTGKTPTQVMSVQRTPEKITRVISDVMDGDTTKYLKPLRDVLLHLLLFIRDHGRPSADFDQAYKKMEPYLLFARLEGLNLWCKNCRTELQFMRGCEHSWECDKPECKNDMALTPFCSECVEFGTEALGAKRRATEAKYPRQKMQMSQRGSNLVTTTMLSG